MRTPAAHGAHLAVDVLYGEADLHEVQHDGVLGQQLPALSFEVVAQVSILHALSRAFKAAAGKACTPYGTFALDQS